MCLTKRSSPPNMLQRQDCLLLAGKLWKISACDRTYGTPWPVWQNVMNLRWDGASYHYHLFYCYLAVCHHPQRASKLKRVCPPIWYLNGWRWMPNWKQREDNGETMVVSPCNIVTWITEQYLAAAWFESLNDALHMYCSVHNNNKAECQPYHVDLDLDMTARPRAA